MTIWRFFSSSLAECDIDYIAPSAYVPPDDGMANASNGMDDDPYAKLVQGSLQKLDKQKVSQPDREEGDSNSRK